MWVFRTAHGETAALVVEPPITVTSIGANETGVSDLFRDRETFSPLSPIDSLLDLPDRAENALLLWDGASPLDRSAEEVARLEAWLERGGTLFAVGAPPFRGSEEPTPLDRILPSPLPAPPRPPARDHGVLLLDLSGSIDRATLETLWAGVETLLEGTPIDDRWAVAAFRENPSWILAPGAPLDNSAIDRVRDAARSGGGTRLDRALTFAQRAITRSDPEAPLAPSIVVLTDGRSSGADWESIGRTLRADRIECTFLALGQNPNFAVLNSLANATGGVVRPIPDIAEAITSLAEVLSPRTDRWHPATSPLTATGRWRAHWPANASAPARLLLETKPTRDLAPAEPLLLDKTGRALVTSRAIGRGRTVVFWSGLDPESLGHGRSAERFRASLAAAIAREVRGAPRGRREMAIEFDAAGGGPGWRT